MVGVGVGGSVDYNLVSRYIYVRQQLLSFATGPIPPELGNLVTPRPLETLRETRYN